MGEEGECFLCREEPAPPARCNCRTFYVHEACLNRWRSSAFGRRSRVCTVCHCDYGYPAPDNQAPRFSLPDSCKKECINGCVTCCTISACWGCLALSNQIWPLGI